jgi:hypothetical protein
VFGIKYRTPIEETEKVISSYTGYTYVDAYMYIAELEMLIYMTVMKKPAHKKRSHKSESWVEFSGYVFTFPLVTVFIPKYAKQGKLQINKNPLFRLTYENVSYEGNINLSSFGTLALSIVPPPITMWTHRNLSQRSAATPGSDVTTSMSLFEAMIL